MSPLLSTYYFTPPWKGWDLRAGDYYIEYYDPSENNQFEKPQAFEECARALEVRGDFVKYAYKRYTSSSPEYSVIVGKKMFVARNFTKVSEADFKKVCPELKYTEGK